MNKKWILVDIGCIECGEESKVVGLFNSKEESERYWDEEYTSKVTKGNSWGRREWSGQHHPHIEEIEVPTQ